MKKYPPITQEELDDFVKEHNEDPSQKCKFISIRIVDFIKKETSNKNLKK